MGLAGSSEALEVALLPAWFDVLPMCFFRGCYRLASVSLRECRRLVRLGRQAFDMCLSLREPELPFGLQVWGARRCGERVVAGVGRGAFVPVGFEGSG